MQLFLWGVRGLQRDRVGCLHASFCLLLLLSVEGRAACDREGDARPVKQAHMLYTLDWVRQ